MGAPRQCYQAWRDGFSGVQCSEESEPCCEPHSLFIQPLLALHSPLARPVTPAVVTPNVQGRVSSADAFHDTVFKDLVCGAPAASQDRNVSDCWETVRLFCQA